MLCSFVLTTGHKVFPSLLYFLTGSGTLAVSHPIAASTPEGSSYGAIGISYESILMCFLILQPLMTVRVGKSVKAVIRLDGLYKMNWLDDLEDSFQS